MIIHEDRKYLFTEELLPALTKDCFSYTDKSVAYEVFKYQLYSVTDSPPSITGKRGRAFILFIAVLKYGKMNSVKAFLLEIKRGRYSWKRIQIN